MRLVHRSFVLFALAAAPQAQTLFVNWETPHVHPIDVTPNDQRVLAVNTADARLEVFQNRGSELTHLTSIPVGLDPVTVRARDNTEAWVVNHVSDSISIVDLATGRVKQTLATDDEPCDVVFAGVLQAFVSCSQANTILVFDLQELDAEPTRITLDAEDPRALAVGAKGAFVYAAIFESGNNTTILGGGKKGNDTLDFPPNAVSRVEGPYGGENPPPNVGETFDPPQNANNPKAPKVGLIVRKDDEGRWIDDNEVDWTGLVSGEDSFLSGRPEGWDLLDRDIAVIDTQDLSVSYIGGLMNVNMALAVRPIGGRISVVGTDATNEIRFEPRLKGRFLQVLLATVDVFAGEERVQDLNPHLTYGKPTIRQEQRDLALGDPRGIAWHDSGDVGIVSGMGSNNVVLLDFESNRVGKPIEVGEGPTGVVFGSEESRAFVLNKFDASISLIDTVAGQEVQRVPFYDPSPVAIRAGRKHLYDTHKNSGLGQIACASCHVDARTDRLSWDLGDPAGEVASVDGQNLGAGQPLNFTPYSDFHPMKGPMLTQTLQDIIGKEPLHWRGDRNGIEDFAPAFMGLQGDDETLTDEEMQEFEDFLATIHFPPNPFRNFDNSLPDDLPLPGHFTVGKFQPEGQPLPNGNAQRGLDLFLPPTFMDGGLLACSSCHTLPTGMGTDMEWKAGVGYEPMDVGPNGEHHHALTSEDGSTQTAFKIPQLRALHERTGFTMAQTTSTAGFGYLHDGSIPSIERFVSLSAFEMNSDQDVADMVAFMLSLSGSDLPNGATNTLHEPPGTASLDTHAAVGKQLTLASVPADASPEADLANAMLALADAGVVGLVAKGRADGEARGYTYLGGGAWQSDRAHEMPETATLLAGADRGAELTLTVVPEGTQVRIGIDRDEDGIFDMDEVDAGSNPADPDSTPEEEGSSATARELRGAQAQSSPTGSGRSHVRPFGF